MREHSNFQIHKCFWLVGSSPDGNNFWGSDFNLSNVALEPFSLPASTNSRTSRKEGLYSTGRSQICSSITNPGSMSHWTNPLKLCKIQWKERNSLSCPRISETIDTMGTSTLLEAKRDPTDCRSRRHLATSYKSTSSWPVDSNAQESCNVVVSKSLLIYKICRA